MTKTGNHKGRWGVEGTMQMKKRSKENDEREKK